MFVKIYDFFLRKKENGTFRQSLGECQFTRTTITSLIMFFWYIYFSSVWEVQNFQKEMLKDLLSVILLVRRISNYYPNYPTHCLYFGEVEKPYSGTSISIDA